MEVPERLMDEDCLDSRAQRAVTELPPPERPWYAPTMADTGETDLDVLLKNLAPEAKGQWAFVVIKSQNELGDTVPLMTFAEDEGITAIVPADEANALDTRLIATRIDLTVHSSLSAVGLTAAVTRALADRQIPANVVAAVHHDYLFVPSNRTDEAMAILQGLATKLGTQEG